MTRSIRIIFPIVVVLIVAWWLLSGNSNSDIKPPEGMVYIPGSQSMRAFFMDETPVTVGQFRKFVTETGYKTQAENFGDAGVFTIDQGWHLVKGAFWEFPLGPENEKAMDDHPVTEISYNDAMAYAKWAGKRLPTRQEFDYAASNAGEAGSVYNWGDQLVVKGKFMANTWQGSFPYYNSNQDGYALTSPVGAFGKTQLGLADISGNVWEWSTDWSIPEGISENDFKPDSLSQKILVGGSFLCDPNVCHGYRLGGETTCTPETGLFHIGFRCVKDIRTL